MVTDDAFKALANQVEQEEREKAERKANGGFTYEKLKWVGIPQHGTKIIRGLGEAPNTYASKFTARTVRHAIIRADNGKDIHVNLPNPSEDDSHIMWRIINHVLQVEWVDKKKTYLYEKSCPEIFDMITHNRRPAGTDLWKYDKGWSGQDMFIMNCIDRDPVVYEWSKQNKHSVLLSKGVRTRKTPDGKVLEFPTQGVPAYGFINLLAQQVFKFYGDWREYDLSITRTGQTTTPYFIKNASANLLEVSEELKSFVVNGSLSEEEKSWELYDLDKLFHVTSYTKLFNRLRKSIAQIDVAFGTHFEEELKALADEEVKMRKASEETFNEDLEPEDDVVEEKVILGAPSNPAITSRVPRTTVSVGVPKGYSRLSPSEQALISSMRHKEGNTWEIEYNTTGRIAGCNICKTPSPETFSVCPGCGADF